jgi:CheY-like chemotaxis protein
MLRNVNHEIRIPINNTKLSVDYFAENWQKPKFQEHAGEVVAGLKSNMDRLYKYVSHLLDLSQYQDDKMMFDIKPRNFKKFLEDVAEQHENVLLKYSVKVPDEIEFDELKMTELFAEITLNANEFGEGNIIEISVDTAGPIVLNNQEWDRIRVSIKDNGIGIDEAEVAEIFEPFFVGSKTKSSAGGRGLGLAIAKEITRGHLGEISAKNNDGHGATIAIILPIIHPKPDFLASNAHVEVDIPEIDLKQIVSNYAELETHFKGRVPKIMMIEDERVVREMGGLMVTSLGYDFLGVPTGEQAVEYILSPEFDADLILLDMMLGDTDGAQIMRKVHKKLAEKGVPVIIQSGLSAGDNLIEEALQLGAKCLMNKPYSRKNFQDMLKKYLGLE